jgi:HPt (histidine-containing phosphotransfer) domain-containing protein
MSEQLSQPVDFSEMAEIYGINDEAMFREKLVRFVTISEANVAALCDAIRAEDWQTVYERAHSMKSASRFVGALPLGDFLERIEAAGRNGGDWPEGWQDAIDKFQAMFGDVKAFAQDG